ncbi:MAG: WecB/TagA/CpsF family glycosyltransferase, partial [Bacteroidota bacterium]
FMQRMGMEWFFRFLSEPRRLFARYFFGSFRFLVVLFRQAMGRPFNASTKKPHYQKAEHPA